jgi:hypothetical protein
MLKVQPDSTSDSNAAQGSSAAKVLADYVAMSEEKPSPAPSATSPGTGRGEELPLPVPGDDCMDAGGRVTPGAVTEGRGEGLPLPREIGGRIGPEPTRFGDWEKSGRCIDF